MRSFVALLKRQVCNDTQAVQALDLTTSVDTTGSKIHRHQRTQPKRCMTDIRHNFVDKMSSAVTIVKNPADSLGFGDLFY